jgi:predicted nucleotidyltransferase
MFTGTCDKIYTKVRRLVESEIDFPQDKLSPNIWNKSGDGDTQYEIKDEVRNKLLAIVEKYPDIPLREIAENINLLGSLCTNQYTENADIDVHVVPDKGKIKKYLEKSKTLEEVRDQIEDWYHDHEERIGGHRVEIYLQLDPAHELMADGMYELEKKEWVKKPRIVSKAFNPYSEYSHVLDDLKDIAGEADLLIGELERNVVDYDTLKEALKKLPKDQKEKIKTAMEKKLGEIEHDIEKLIASKDEWKERRRKASAPATPEQALKDVEYIQQWHDENANFKFLDRYNYLQLIRDLKDMLEEEGSLDDKDVKEIEDLLGVTGVANGK